MNVTYTLPNIALRAKMELLGVWGVNDAEIAGGLFTSPTSISDTLDFASLVQATFPGYAYINPTGYTATGDNTTTQASCSFAPYTWICSSAPSVPETIQGSFWAMDAGTISAILAIALFPGGPQVISGPGDNITSQLTLTDQRQVGQP